MLLLSGMQGGGYVNTGVSARGAFPCSWAVGGGLFGKVGMDICFTRLCFETLRLMDWGREGVVMSPMIQRKSAEEQNILGCLVCFDSPAGRAACCSAFGCSWIG